ncbi:hypothetical protein Gotur_017769, partial [Gossypium turneri]
MELKWLAMVLVVLSLGAGLCDGCLEEERFALFQLKPFFEFIDYKFQDLDYGSKLEKESSSNCCEWERVECNLISGRITHPFLNYSSNMKRDWYLNASLFLPFEKLQNLSLSRNFITGCVANQGFERLSSKLDKLENLGLSDNHFNNSILASLSELSLLNGEMESKWLAMVLVVLSLGSGLCDGCLEEERFALFQLKPFFELIDYKFQDLINGNIVYEKESSSNCCEWERVECNPITGRVTHLFLNYSSNMEIDWYLNASLFLPFAKLQNISLRGNFITGCVANQGLLSFNFIMNIYFFLLFCMSKKSFQLLPRPCPPTLLIYYISLFLVGFERLSSKLDKLENLDLSDNHFNNSILASLSELSLLKSLNLARNLFTRSNPTNGIEMLSKLNNLETLDLSGNRLGNKILSQLNDLNALSNLEELILYYNEVNGFIPSQGLRLMNLKHLDLSANGFNNSILASLATLPNLKTLSIGISQCNGLIDVEDLYGFSNLEELTMASYT